MEINALKELINQRINTKTEGEEKIKASEHNEVLHAVVDTLVLLGTQNFKGIASTTTNPGTPAGPVFYLAEGIGSYTHFNTDVTEKLAFLVWDNLDWRAVQIHVDVDVEIDNIEEYLTSEVLNNTDIAFKSKDNTYEGVSTFKGPVIVENDIIQKGETYKATWLDLEIKDNLAIINKGEVGSGITKVLPGTNRMFAGWGADRGLRETFYWGLDDTDPDNPQWKIGKADSLQAVATRQDSPTDGYPVQWNSINKRFESVSAVRDSFKLGGVSASNYARTDVDETFNAKVWLGGQITGSNAKLQVNGFMRTGNIYLHTGGNTPNTDRTSDYLSNYGGILRWYTNNASNDVYHSGNVNKSDVDWTVKNLNIYGNSYIKNGSYLRFSESDETRHNRLLILSDAGGALFKTDYSSGGNLDIRFQRYNTEVFRIASGGVKTIGYITATDYIKADTHFTSSDNYVTLSTGTTNGTVWLRPNGMSSTTSQSYFTTSLATIGTNADVIGRLQVKGEYVRIMDDSTDLFFIGSESAALGSGTNNILFSYDNRDIINYVGGEKFRVTTTGTKTTGNHTATGQIISTSNNSYDSIKTDGGITVDTYFCSSDGAAVLGTGVNGTIFLRPRGKGTTANETKFTGVLATIGTDTVINGHVGSPSYTSGIGGKGTWRISQNANAEFDNLDIREGLTVNTFTNNQINISNGDLIVSDNGEVFVLHPNGDRFYTAAETPFQVGDILRCQYSKSAGNIKSYYLTVADIVDSTVQFDENGNPRKIIVFNNKTGDDVEVGDLIVRWNSSIAARKGLLYLSSSSTHSPFYDVVYDGKTVSRFGKLDGITSSIFGNLSGYGFWTQNGYLEGGINASFGKIADWSIKSDRITKRFGNIDTTIGTQDSTSIKGFHVYQHNSTTGGNRVSMGYLSDDNWGIWGTKDGSNVFRLGSHNTIAGWTFDGNYLYSGDKYSGVAGASGLELRSGSSSRVIVHSGKGYVNLYRNSDTSWGIAGKDSSGTTVFQLGSTNNIAGWKFNESQIYNGNIHITTGVSGIYCYDSGNKWVLRQDGSGSLASNNIVWDTAGNVTFSDNVKLKWANVTNQPTILNDSDVTTITQNTVTSSFINGRNCQFTQGKIGSFTIGGSYIHSNVDSKFLTLQNSETDIVHAGARRGLNLYVNNDKLASADSVKIIQLGMLCNKDTANAFPSTPNYGFRITKGNGDYKDIFRADVDGAFIANWSFNESYLWSGSSSPKTSNGFATSGITLSSGGAIRAKNFRIDTDGNAYFKGEVTATSGKFGDFKILTGYIDTDKHNFKLDTANGKLSLYRFDGTSSGASIQFGTKANSTTSTVNNTAIIRTQTDSESADLGLIIESYKPNMQIKSASSISYYGETHNFRRANGTIVASIDYSGLNCWQNIYASGFIQVTGSAILADKGITVKGKSEFKGAVVHNIIRTGSTYYCNADSHTIVATGANYIYLPSSPETGREIRVKRDGTGEPTIKGNGYNIKLHSNVGVSEIRLNNTWGQAMILQYDGSYWQVMADIW